MEYKGGCHCGNISLLFKTDIPADQMEVRACQCSFCRKHASRAIADPNGRLRINVADDAQVALYTFGLETADYVICRRRGVYVAALTKDESDRRGIAIVNVLVNAGDFNAPLIPVDYSAEITDERLARRRSNWTPARLSIGN